MSPLSQLPLTVVAVLGLLSVAQAKLTQSHLTIFRGKGVVVKDNGESYTFSHSGIPKDHEIGDFPNKDNPNTASEQNYEFEIPKNPTVLEEPGCLGLGPIAMTINGIPMFNPFTGVGTNAVEYEVFDSCHGHPDNRGQYHYHQIPKCVYQGGEDELMGVAFDGYPIYGPKTTGGADLTTADLDLCHGQTRNGAYEYRITADFPYILGCYKGATLESAGEGDGGMGGMPPMEGTPPPKDGTPPPKEGMEGMPAQEGMDGGMDGGMGGGMGGPGAMDWSSCYARVGCENPADQVGDDACDDSAVGVQASVVVVLLVSLVGMLM